jgi:uncharacterized membrane protein
MKRIAGRNWMISIYGLALVILLVLGSVLMVSHPVVWEKVHRSAMKEKLKEVHYQDANRITGGLWTQESYEKISDSLKVRKMNKKEINHYEDVRSLLGKARIVVGVCAGVVFIGFMWAGWRRVWNSGFIIFVLLGIILGVWMLIDWHSLFKSLHWVIFLDDSWKLPNRSYSLGLFPHAVWQLAGGVIGGLVMIFLLIPMFFRKKIAK